MQTAWDTLKALALAAFFGALLGSLTVRQGEAVARGFHRLTGWPETWQPARDDTWMGYGAAVGAGLFVVRAVWTWIANRWSRHHPSPEVVALRTDIERLCRAIPLMTQDEIPPERQQALAVQAGLALSDEQRLARLTEGQAGDFGVALFDLDDADPEGSDETGFTPRQTVVLLTDALPGVPTFELRPRGFLDRLFGTGLRFRAARDWSEGRSAARFRGRYVLSSQLTAGSREEAILGYVFAADTLAFLADNPGWQVRARDGRLALSRAGSPCPAEERTTLLAEALILARVFRLHLEPRPLTITGTTWARWADRAAGLVALAGMTAGTSLLLAGVGSFAGGTLGRMVGWVAGLWSSPLDPLAGFEYGSLLGAVGLPAGLLLLALWASRTPERPTR